MKLIMVTIRDTVAENCNGGISLYENVNVAKRAFENSVRIILQEGNPQNIPLNDLRQYKIGEFDTETMEITPCNEFIEAGSTYVVKYGSMPTPKPEIKLVGEEPIVEEE